MPHTQQCQEQAPEGFCIGGCTITPEDLPGLFEVLQSAVPPAPPEQRSVLDCQCRGGPHGGYTDPACR